MVLGSVLSPINSSILAVALVPVSSAFHTPMSTTVWLVSALYATTCVGQPLAGELVDRFGPRSVYLAGSGLVGVGGVIGVVAPTFGVLLAARIIIGLGTCASFPSSMRLIRTVLSSDVKRTEPSGLLALLSICNQSVAVAGPTLGGILLDTFGWRAIFALNVPLSAACLALGYAFFPDAAAARAEHNSRQFDLLGLSLLSLTLLPLVFWAMTPQSTTLWLVLVSIVSLSGLILHERRCSAPIIDVHVLAHNTPLSLTYLRTVLVSTTSYLFIYGFTQWLQTVRGCTAAVTGALLVPTFGLGVLAAVLTRNRRCLRGKLVVSALAHVIAAISLLVVSSSTNLWTFAAIAAAAGLPQGLANIAIQHALYLQAEPDRIGNAAGMLRMFTYIGAICAGALTGFFYRAAATTGSLRLIAIVMLSISVLYAMSAAFDRALTAPRQPHSSNSANGSFR